MKDYREGDRVTIAADTTGTPFVIVRLEQDGQVAAIRDERTNSTYKYATWKLRKI